MAIHIYKSNIYTKAFIYTVHCSNFGVSKSFVMFLKEVCSPRLHVIDQKYSIKTVILWKYLK